MGGQFGSNSIIFTLADSGIKDIDDLKGRTFAFVDPGSTSGYLFPSAAFKEAGIDPEKDFASVFFAGTHTAAQLAVKNGTVDAAASNLPSYKLLIERGEIDPEKQVIIWTSKEIPASPVVIRTGLSDELRQKIIDAFLSAPLTRGLGLKTFEAYREMKDSDFDAVRQVAETLGIKEEP
jgi:phosphonate transport system substrate-binding protein